MKAYKYLEQVGVPRKYLFSSFDEGLKNLKEIDMDAAMKNRYLDIYRIIQKLVADRKYGAYLHGANGSGKTYLGAAMLRAYLFSGLAVARTTPREVIDWYHDDYQGMRPRYLVADVLLIDEMGKEVDYRSMESHKVIEELIKAREEGDKITIYTANAPQQALRDRYGETVLQVIEGLSVEVEFPKFDFRKYNLIKYVEDELQEKYEIGGVDEDQEDEQEEYQDEYQEEYQEE